MLKRRPDRLRDRYVYFVRGHLTGRIKIGMADDPYRRLLELQQCSPDVLELLAFALVPNPSTVERQLHVTYDDWRLHGEWFEPNKALWIEIEKVRRYHEENGVPLEPPTVAIPEQTAPLPPPTKEQWEAAFAKLDAPLPSAPSQMEGG